MRYLALALAGFALACAKDTGAVGDEAKIRGLDSAWAKAAAAKDLDQATAVYADNASMLAPGEPIATGKTAIRAAWQGMLGLPAANLTFGPDKIDVSGDRAIDLGTYTLTYNDKAGKPQTSKARYVVVWGRQADGTWKVLVDTPTTTQ
ncbi:MAG TPA: SgcJ/EcaC family oxidoreductase [Gemmatimonadaceae bacterium]|nr:SgcJ/EcaC family oxidoreductase [Gemmatimonadaceae bacterium]